MARDLPSKATQGRTRGRVGIEDFVLLLKELKVLYGPAIDWKFNYPGKKIKVILRTDKGKRRVLVARLSNSRMDGGHPDMVTSVKFLSKNPYGEEVFFRLETFKKFVIGSIEKT
jgi:hypothetical protein